MDNNKPDRLKRLRSVLCLALVALYFIGLIFLMTGLFYAGVVFWAVSTVGGIGLLYYIRTTEKTQEAVNEALKEEEALARQEDSDD